MITTEQAKIYILASDAVYGDASSTAELAQLGYTLAVDKNTDKSLFIDDPKTGFYAVIYQNAVTGEALVAFTGTQDGKDAVADLALGKTQWKNNKDKVFAVINALTDATKITFTGHSLGGALAQYGAYDYLTTPLPGNQPPLPVVVATFNGLNGLDGLKQMNLTFDASIASQINANYFVAASSGQPDLVSRIGGAIWAG